MPRLVAMVSLALFVVACGSDNNKKREFLSNEDIRVDGTEEKIRSIHESGPTPYFPFQELLANTYDIEAVSSSALTHYAKHVAANIDVLHAAWLNTSSIDVAKRQRIAHLFFRLLKNTDEEPFAWNSNGSGEGLVSETRLAELFQCLLAFNDKTRNFALFAYQQNDFMDESNECVRVLADQLESAPVEVLYVYGEAILETQFPPQTLPRAWEAVRAAYDVALKRDQQGLEAKRPYDWSLPCVYIGGRRFRESVIAALDDLPDQYTVSMLLHVMQNETVPELLDAAASALKAQNQHIDSESMVEVIHLALVIDNVSFNNAALEMVASHRLASKYADELEFLVTRGRPAVRQKASELLKSIERSVEVPAITSLPPSLAERMKGLCLQLALDPTKAARGTARVQKERGSEFFSEDKEFERMPGWINPDGVFVSDELYQSPLRGDELEFTPHDFMIEINEILDGKTKYLSDDKDRFPLHDPKIVGQHEHDVLRLAYLVCIENETGEVDQKRTDLLYAHVIERYSSDTRMIEQLAFDMAWPRFERMVRTYSKANDKAAREEAEKLILLKSYTITNESVTDWVRDAERVLESLCQREANRISDSPPWGRDAALDYWISRLPDVRVEQHGQPGWTELSRYDNPVADAIRSFGPDAALPLYDHLEDERLIRGYGFWRDFHQSRTLNTVGDAAGMLLGKIIKDDLGEEVDSALFYPGHRDDFVKWLEPHLAAHRRNRMLWWGSITAVGIAVVILYWRRGVVRRKREGSQPPQPEKT